MSEAIIENNGAQVHELGRTGTKSPISVSPRGNLYQVLGICDDGSEEIMNCTSKRCLACRWLRSKNTIAWKGAAGKAVTVRHCLKWSPCEGTVVRRDL